MLSWGGRLAFLSLEDLYFISNSSLSDVFLITTSTERQVALGVEDCYFISNSSFQGESSNAHQQNARRSLAAIRPFCLVFANSRCPRYTAPGFLLVPQETAHYQ